MPMILNHQMREHIPHNNTVFPITFFHDELTTLRDYTGFLHWHPDFEIATAELAPLDFQIGLQHITLQPGESIFINENVLHAIRQLSDEVPDPMPNIVFSGALVASESAAIYQKYIRPIACCESLPYIVFRRKEGWHGEENRLVKDIYSRMRTQEPCYEMAVQRETCSGASEASMAQWASAFTESALGVSKAVGDLAGPCLFAVCMGLARALYVKISRWANLSSAMLACGVLCVACYLIASLSASPFVGRLGCALCGAAVGMMWPGSISISMQKCPTRGTSMFAFLALAGDLGATISPAMVGGVAQVANGDLKAGLLTATVFPLVLIVALILLKLKFFGGGHHRAV